MHEYGKWGVMDLSQTHEYDEERTSCKHGLLYPTMKEGQLCIYLLREHLTTCTFVTLNARRGLGFYTVIFSYQLRGCLVCPGYMHEVLNIDYL